MENSQNGNLKFKTNHFNFSCFIAEKSVVKDIPEINSLRDEFNLQRARMKEIYIQKDCNYINRFWF